MGADLSSNIFIEHALGTVSETPLVMATAVTAFICGVWLAAVIATATLSHLQRHMQEQVRRWQRRAVRAEHAAKNHESG
ncbi:hypothetical protein E1292_26350 [Nonomuraea deserti]|uniref:Uncharacterized protein n=1 Tax=Nonomuraea deserti TaxID=1848322 RepID=A0A4R4VH16_9ACTN|nr:hypothetical protein [Nonomuraea deserti]TDD01335.1 hypothetical protein E1292_26350 [Nonomuraea deserti]